MTLLFLLFGGVVGLDPISYIEKKNEDMMKLFFVYLCCFSINFFATDFQYFGSHLASAVPWVNRVVVMNSGLSDENFTISISNRDGEVEINESYTVPAMDSIVMVMTSDNSYQVADDEIRLDSVDGTFIIATSSHAIRPLLSFQYGDSPSISQFFLTETLENQFMLPNMRASHFSWSGMAVMNPNDQEMQISLEAFEAGASVGYTTVEIPSNTKYVAVSDDIWVGLGQKDFDRIIVSADLEFPAPIVLTGNSNQDRHLFFLGVPTHANAQIEAGSYTTMVPSQAAGTQGIVTRVFFPGTANRRFPQGAPIVVMIPGGHQPGSLSPEGIMPGTEKYGFIYVQMIMPGGTTKDGLFSGGDYDYRGPKCVEAIKDVLRYALGQFPDQSGKKITDKIPFAMTSNVGLIGLSHGGNAGLVTLAEYGEELADIKWVVTWESPLGDQYVNIELNGNPYYQPGTATELSCPVDGMEEQLRFDPNALTLFRDFDLDVEELPGALFLDSNGNGRFDRGIDRSIFAGNASRDEQGIIRMNPSVELAEMIESHSATVFGSNSKPSWLPGLEETRNFWYWRDAAQRLSEVTENHPDLFIMLLGTEKDHVQTQPDHPHIMSPIMALNDNKHAFWRLNPDAAYLSLVSGIDASLIPENDKNTLLEWPENGQQILPENISGIKMDPHISTAGILEMVDRIYTGSDMSDLDAVLID